MNIAINLSQRLDVPNHLNAYQVSITETTDDVTGRLARGREVYNNVRYAHGVFATIEDAATTLGNSMGLGFSLIRHRRTGEIQLCSLSTVAGRERERLVTFANGTVRIHAHDVAR